jgi:small conductance mechanosensitive channel
MSGFMMAVRRPFDVGDLVEVAGKRGRIQHIALRASEIQTLDGLSILIPNREIFQNPITNYTSTPNRRMELSVGTAYGDDLEKVRSVVIEAVQSVPKRNLERDVELFFTEFGDSSINFVVRVWLNQADEITYFAARSEAMIAIKKAFDQKGITIPFPIRTLDFGADAVGGTRLDGMALRVASAAAE